MEEIYRISGQNSNNALLELLFQNLAVAKMNAEMQANILANQEGTSVEEIKRKYEGFYQSQKQKIRDEIYSLFGDLDMDDLLKPGTGE